MMQQGDYGSPYYQQYNPPSHFQNPNRNPNPNPNPSPPTSIDPQPNPLPTTYASAPPFSSNYSSSSDFPGFSSPYPPYSQNSDPVSTLPSSAPSYAQTPNFQSINPSPQPSSPHLSFPPAPAPAPVPVAAPVAEPQAPYPPTLQQPSYYPAYDQHQASTNYGPSPPPPSSIPPTPAPIPNTNPSFSAPYSTSSYTQLGSSVPPHMYDNAYDGGVKFDHGVGGGGYLDDNSARCGGQGLYGGSRSDMGLDFYDKRPDGAAHYDRGGLRDDAGHGDGVYAYDGGRMDPYGARGTAPKSSTWSSTAFDDYGRSLSFPSPGKEQVTSGSAKIVRAVPKSEAQQDVKNGVLKFRVKLLPEGSSQGTMDVLCQIGLDGIRMLDPNTSRTLRIYPLETVTRWEGNSSIFAFWSKSSVDIEPRRIRLQSNNYTTNTILDTVTAATVQLKEMSGSFKTSDSVKTTEQPTERKKGFVDWVNLIKPGNEEKDHWVPDDAVTKCTACGTDFGAFVRRHHCRNCGDIFCDKCTSGRIALTAEETAQPVRVCDHCMAEVTERLSSAKESASKPAVLETHEDLAKKLQEEMDRNRKASSGSKSEGSGRRMREVACPTCTVHLQVQIPSSGSETIECGVCQHPFLVGAH